MKIFLFIIAIALSTQSYSQKYYTKTGQIDFEASVQAFEPVKATHKAVTAILDVTSGDIAILALMKGFRFRNALMEEHFNENYIESDTYPKASFKGTIPDFSKEKLASNFSFIVEGTLTLHGTSKEITTTITLKKVDDAIAVMTDFSVSPSDFNIEIPGVVHNKISETIDIKTRFNLIER